MMVFVIICHIFSDSLFQQSQWIFVGFNKQLHNSTLALIHINTSIEPQFITKNWNFVCLLVIEITFLSTIVHVFWFWGRPYHLMIHQMF